MKCLLFDSYVIRTPLFSFKNISSIETENDILEMFLSCPDFKEAIYIASPLIYSELEKIVSENIVDPKKIKHVLQTTLRYFTRMSTRCTPFGLFAGCAVVKPGSESRVDIKKSFQRVTRLDICHLYKLSNSIISNQRADNEIIYYSNNSLLKINDRYRYISENSIDNQQFYHVLGVKYTSYLNEIIKKSKRGLSISELAKLLINENINEEEAIDYINRLIDSHLLQNELTLSMIGLDYFTHLINILEKNKSKSSELQILKNIQLALWKLDNESHNIDLYKKIAKELAKFNIPINDKTLFHVDVIRKTTNATFSPRIEEELRSTITLLNRITPISEKTVLTEFKDDFISRYNEQEIPLMQALDTEIGLGYPSRSGSATVISLVDELDLPQQSKFSNKKIYNSPLHSLLLQKTIECLTKNEMEIVLTDEDIVGLTTRWEDIPLTFSCIFEILQDDNEGILINFKSTNGNGANLLTRFAHADEQIKKLVKNITTKEQDLIQNSILAEIVYSSKASESNILYRPHVREYELLYMAHSDLPSHNVIQISDLMVSIRHGKLILRSKKLNKEIVPRLTSAYYYKDHPLPIFRFLCDIQNQNVRDELYFSWGELENLLLFFPRIRYKNTILSEAKWKVKISDIKMIFETVDDNLLTLNLNSWRKSISLPSQVTFSEGDNKLFIDWENPLIARSSFSILKKNNEVVFEKYSFNSETAIVKGVDGSYTNECIAIFHINKHEKETTNICTR